MKPTIGRSKMRVLVALAVTFMMLAIPVIAVASGVDASVVDATAPIGSVTLAPGDNTPITINLTVTGNQVGTATFDVYRNWTLSGGTFSGSNPQTFTVGPRAAQDPATTFSTPGIVTVATGQTAGTFTLAVGAFNITNSNTTGAKLGPGSSSNYKVTVFVPTDTTPPSISYTLNPSLPDGANSWYKSNVTLVWSISEPESLGSLVKTGCVDQNITADQPATTYSCSAKSTGGSAGPVEVPIKRDAALPNAPTPVVSPAPNGAGWNKTDVTVSFTGNGDNGPSGLASCTVASNLTSETTGTTVSGTCTDNAGNTSAGAPVTVKIDKTPPTISASAKKADNTPYAAGTWTNQTVTVHFDCGDLGGSGVASCPSDATYSTDGTFSANGTVSDNAGNSASTSFGPIQVDKTPPIITFVNRTSANGYGWNNGDVTVNWSCADSLSGVVAATTSKSVATEGANQSATGTCTDNAGNSASNSQTGINIDKTPPTITFVNRTPANGYGWNNGDVTVNWSCADSLSGVVAATTSKTVATEGANQSATGTCTDKADNSASDTQSGINIDKTAPTLNPGVLPARVLLNGTATASPNATDTLSGVASSSCGPVVTSTVGPHSVSCSATDKAGNVGNGTANYNVAYAFIGLLPPYAPPTQKLFKSGSTFPIKWQYADANGVIQNSAAANPATPIIYTAVCTSSSSPLDPVDDAGSSGLRYDSTTNMWIYDWKTPAYSPMCYDISIKSQQSGQTDGPFPFGTK